MSRVHLLLEQKNLFNQTNENTIQLIFFLEPYKEKKKTGKHIFETLNKETFDARNLGLFVIVDGSQP
jgi:hypothetical protein